MYIVSPKITPFIYKLLKNSRTFKDSPHDIFPSGHTPFKHPGPALINMLGATSLTAFNILQANSLISHCARIQHLWSKKLSKLLALKVHIKFVFQAFGSTYLASSIDDFLSFYSDF